MLFIYNKKVIGGTKENKKRFNKKWKIDGGPLGRGWEPAGISTLKLDGFEDKIILIKFKKYTDETKNTWHFLAKNILFKWALLTSE